MTVQRNMCFAALTGCFGAINTSPRNIDLGGDDHTGRHTESCFRVASQVSTNRRVRRSWEVGASLPPKLRGRAGGRCCQPTAESPASGCGRSSDRSAVSSGRRSDRMGIGEAGTVGRKVDREIIARRNSRRGGMMIKLNFCFIFCRGWWAFLLLQLHMLQALAQGRARDIFVYRNAASASKRQGISLGYGEALLALSEVNCRIHTEPISYRNGRFLHTIVSLWNRDLQTVPTRFSPFLLLSFPYPNLPLRIKSPVGTKPAFLVT